MAIIQISKLQQRSGNLVDLPQLDEAELGWASDERRLFIGKTTPNENVEILTSYSDISFSQLTGSVGNLNINPATLAEGQVLSYNGENWVNKGRDAGGLLTLGDVGNVKLDGGAIGYVLETDGTGNLSWSPKGFLFTDIEDLTPDAGNTQGYGANAVVMTVAETTPYFNLAEITISGVEGNSNSNVNARTFYLQLSNDYPTSGNVILLTDPDVSNVFVDGDITYTNDPNSLAVATSAALGTGGGIGGGAAFPPVGAVQYNDSGLLKGDNQFTFNESTNSLNVGGNIDATNFNASNEIYASRFISNVTGNTSPFVVNSTEVVANLNVENATTAGTVTTNAQPNITSVGNLTSLTVDGNLSTDVITANTVNATTGAFTDVSGNGSALTALDANNVTTGTLSSDRLSGSYAISVDSATTAETVTTNAQPNITSVGTLTSLDVTGTASAGNLSTVGTLSATGNANVGNIGATNGVFTDITVSGNINADDGSFSSVSGEGSALSDLNASNLASGTVPSGRLSGSYSIDGTGSASELATPRSINGTLFDGTNNITTAQWGTGRNITIGSATKFVNGSSDVSWTLGEIGAIPSVTLGVSRSGSSVTVTNNRGDNATIGGATTGDAGVVTTGNQTWNGTKTADDFVANSDERLKNSIKELEPEDCLDKIMSLCPSSFNWNETGEYDTGLIAQQVEKVLSHRVHETEENSLAVSYSKLVTELIGAVQTLNKRVQELENNSSKKQ